MAILIRILFIFLGLYLVPTFGVIFISFSLFGTVLPFIAIFQTVVSVTGMMETSISTLSQGIDIFMASLPVGGFLLGIGLLCGKVLRWYFKTAKRLFQTE